ncbi:hypothetical protein GCM10027059_49170 [Myceligenerans halotolerans]
MAEAFNILFKAEPIRNKGPWHGLDDVEIAEYLDWYNNQGRVAGRNLTSRLPDPDSQIASITR